MKRTVPVVIAAVTGFSLIVAYFIPYTQSWGDNALQWFDIVAAFAIVLGAGNLLRSNLEKISQRAKGWGFSAVTVVAFLVTLVVGMAKMGSSPQAAFPSHPWSGNYIQEGSAFWWIFEYIQAPLTGTMFALLAFFMASASFRAFRAKNVEATLLLGTAFVVLLGRTYAGVVLSDWIPEESLWLPADSLRFDSITGIVDLFLLAGIRAITIGIALGIAATSLKVLLGVDRPYLGSERE
ncbi:MAG: hypothetical protein AB7O26_06045 [Planctomycetaceae bacterium]